MLFDLQSMFSDQQDLGGNAGTAVASTNVIDLGAVDTPKHAAAAITRDFGKGRPVPVRIQVTETFTQDGGSGATQVTVELQSSDVENFGSGVVTHSSVDVPLASLVAGAAIAPFYIPEGVDERYVRLNYTPDAGLGSGKFTAGLVFGKGNWSA